MSYPAKEIIRNIFSVVAGVMIALAIIIPIGLLGGLLNFSDTAIKKSQSIISTVLLIAGPVAGCILGGYTTVKVSTRKDIIHAFITGLVLTFLYAWVNDFEFDWRFPDMGIAYLGFVPTVLAGAIIGIRKKKKINLNSRPSLPDTL